MDMFKRNICTVLESGHGESAELVSRLRKVDLAHEVPKGFKKLEAGIGVDVAFDKPSWTVRNAPGSRK